MGKEEAFYCGAGNFNSDNLERFCSGCRPGTPVYHIVFGTKSSTNLSAVECSDVTARVFTEHQYCLG